MDRNVDNIDLSLVPFETLIDEVERRCIGFVCAGEIKGNDEYANLKFKFGLGKWSSAVALSSILHNEILNNWNGELRVLQRIAKEDGDGV